MRQIRPESVDNLLIRGTNWVGDAVMSVPAMKQIRRIFPKAHICLLVRPWVRDVYGSVDFVDEILIYDKEGLHRGWKGLWNLSAELRVRRFDLAILLQNALEAALIAFWARIPLRLGYARDARGILLTHSIPIDPEVRKVHQVHYYLGILSGAGLLESQSWDRPQTCLDSIEVGVRPEDVRTARELLDQCGVDHQAPVVAINPGASYGGAKRWPAERFAAVADALAQQHKARILLVGSSSERLIAEAIAATMSSPATILSGRTSLGQFMAVLKECDLFITNDSGPMHLAAALNVPQLAIFGSTSEIATGPLSESAKVLKHQVECNPCFLRECPTDFRCMMGLGVEEVLGTARAVLSHTGRI